MSEWGWSPERNLGIWRHGAAWLKPLMAAVPYLTVLLLLVLLWFVGGTMSAARGVLFDLPAGDFSDTARADLVALVMPVRHECVVFLTMRATFSATRAQCGAFPKAFPSGFARARGRRC